MKFRTNDSVKIMVGKDKGKTGKIERLYKNTHKALIPDINMYKKHIKKTEQTPEGGVVALPRALDVSKLAVICPHCNKPTRIGYQITGDKKQRVCKKCKSII